MTLLVFLSVFTWDTYTGNADRLEFLAWVKRPVPVACEQWPTVTCREYEIIAATDRQLLTTDTLAAWDHPLEPGDVMFYTLKACKGECCSL